ncbi:MAG: NUDIX hydrolase [Planctomycetes bacterium]|nr:NUDIX hydrolase [Planctomycetota bacterium]
MPDDETVKTPQLASASGDKPVRRGVVAVIAEGEKLLVIQRALYIPAPGAYCFPGGHIEQNETEEVALARELREELALDVRPTRQLWRWTTSWGVDLSWWRVSVADLAVMKPNTNEVQKVVWCTPAEILTLPNLLESNRRFIDLVMTGEVTLE